MRKQLIQLLKEKGITNNDILEAFDQVPRHYFLDLAFDQHAYSDVAFQIGSGQTISQPYTVAFQTSLLELKKGDKVLEIGTGSGFQTAILCKLGAKVYSIERHKDLHVRAKHLLEKLGMRPNLYFGDGYEGKPVFAPFDKVLVTCGAPTVPPALLEQLKVGGCLVIPVGGEEGQQMLRITKKAENSYQEEVFGNFSFVPMLEKTVK